VSNPKRLSIEYDDGSKTSIDFSHLDRELRSALADLKLCPHSASIRTFKHYLLLQWEGWQEVIGLESESVELLRYYVVRRIEDSGRLSFDVGADNPELFIVTRLPRELKGVVVAGASGMSAYDFSSETERWEGIFESGGKIEYVKYDKSKNSSDQQETPEVPLCVARLREALQSELTQRGLSAGELLALEELRRIEAYREIARNMGIRGKEKQRDVYAFIELLVEQSATSKKKEAKE